MTAGLDLQTANVGNKPTFKNRVSRSVIDVTFVRPRILRILRWEVLSVFSDSDHNYIEFETSSGRHDVDIPQPPPPWLGGS